jgi:hypothetical protein
MQMSSDSYLILTPTVPIKPYMLDYSYIIRAVKTANWMFQGFSLGIPHSYLAIIALPYIDEHSYDVWRDLVLFHSFLCDDPETYDYAERAFPRTHEDLGLRFVTNPSYFFGRITTKSADREYTQTVKRVNALDYDRFPLTVYPTTRETFDTPLTLEEEGVLSSEGTLFSELEPEFSTEIQYRKAFNIFVTLKSYDKTLYNQLRLYVFSRAIKEFHEVYRNWNLSIALNISILEGLAGEPTKCNALEVCPKCGRPIPPHHTESIEEWLIDIYGDWFKKLRRIRQKFFHQSDYFDISDALYEIKDKADEGEEQRLQDYQDEVELLEKITRKSLIKAFLKRYNG